MTALFVALLASLRVTFRSRLELGVDILALQQLERRAETDGPRPPLREAEPAPPAAVKGRRSARASSPAAAK